MLGIDVVKISRIRAMQERFGNRALKKFLHVDEIALAKSTETIAGFYAAKEAVAKALGLGICAEFGFMDIKIYKTKKGVPQFTLVKNIIERFSITELDLSITHDGDYAIAVASLRSTATSSKPLFH
ncbi:MAG: holo-ACP synthase [Sulfurospirillum sp.]|nr:holo-ACP synthase [Sulfurospirillum sp.]